MLKSSILILFLSTSHSFASFPVKRSNESIKLTDYELNSNPIDANSAAFSAVAADVNVGGFALGLLLGLIGVGLAYIFSDDPTFRRSSWYGLGVWIVILLLLGGL